MGGCCGKQGARRTVQHSNDQATSRSEQYFKMGSESAPNHTDGPTEDACGKQLQRIRAMNAQLVEKLYYLLWSRGCDHNTLILF